MRVRELSVSTFKLDKKLKKFQIENKNGKMVKSAPPCSISDVFQAAVCRNCPLLMPCLVR